jgi:hypothetical protein
MRVATLLHILLLERNGYLGFDSDGGLDSRCLN